MRQLHSLELRQPRTDDHALWEIVEGILGYQAFLVAYDLKLFALLAQGPQALAEVCAALNLAPRPAEVLLIVCVSLGLLEVCEGHYSLTPIAEDYLVANSPTFFGHALDAVIANAANYSFDGIKRAVLTNASQVYGGEAIFKSHEEQRTLARSFTEMMHAHSMGPALAWPDAFDLSAHHTLLDIGGGSGAHAIGTVHRWPKLRAVVLDMAPVCEIAQSFIARYGLQSRIRTQVGDMWKDPFPAADLHFYADIYHDWSVEKCRFLTQKSFASLEPGGRILIHEMLYNDEKTGPFPVAGCAVSMLLWTEGQQFSGRELSLMLAEAGFIELEVKPTFGYWSMVSGRKP